MYSRFRDDSVEKKYLYFIIKHVIYILSKVDTIYTASITKKINK